MEMMCNLQEEYSDGNTDDAVNDITFVVIKYNPVL